MYEKRNFHNPQYKAWRKAVRARDKNRCVFPGCRNRTGLAVHHIKPYAAFPTLRFAVANGCVLCGRHHKAVTGREGEYEAMLLGAVGGKVADDLAIDRLFESYRQQDSGEDEELDR